MSDAINDFYGPDPGSNSGLIDKDFVTLPDGDYTRQESMSPIDDFIETTSKWSTGMQGYSPEQSDKIQSGEYFQDASGNLIDNSGNIIEPQGTRLDMLSNVVDMFEPGSVVAPGVKFTTSVVKKLSEAHPKIQMNKAQVEKFLKRRDVPDAQIKMINLPDETMSAGDWLAKIKKDGFATIDNTTRSGRAYSSITLPGSDLDTYSININTFKDAEKVPRDNKYIINPGNHFDDANYAGHSRSTYEELPSGKTRIVQELQSDFATAERSASGVERGYISEKSLNTDLKNKLDEAAKKYRDLSDSYGEANEEVIKAKKKFEAQLSLYERQQSAKHDIEFSMADDELEVAQQNRRKLGREIDRDLMEDPEYAEAVRLREANILQGEELSKVKRVIASKRYEHARGEEFRKLGDIKDEATRVYDDIYEASTPPGMGVGVANFPINNKKFTQHQIMNEVDLALKDGVNKIAIPLKRAGPLYGTEEVTKVYAREIPAAFQSIKKKLEGDGHKVTLDIEPYMHNRTVRDNINDSPTAVNSIDAAVLGNRDRLSTKMKEVKEIDRALYYELYEASDIFADIGSALKGAQRDSADFINDVAEIEKRINSFKGDKKELESTFYRLKRLTKTGKKQVNELVTLEIEPAKGKDIDWLSWGLSGATSAGVASQQNEKEN